MNWDALGAIGELIGGLIVVVTVIYLSRQIRESNKHAKAEAEREVQSYWDKNVVDVTLRDPSIRAVSRKGYGSFEALTDDEKAVFMLLITHVMNHLEMVLRMERDGLLATDIADTYRAVSLSMLGTPGGREFWQMGYTYQELSTRHINQNLNSTDVVPLTKALPFWSAGSSSEQQ